ncbi:Aldo-ket-red domain-containing protein [Mycena chlorophos]|uniref:Aldo-ket-red domain-containing protein n=1 Tax=Mycena chlorophos TaxID=658473 RepID=A0A8H6WIT4_MYCCL|nr:Aldo-ket-red domain-containing protein [Mycena chlorophos]
MATHNQKAAINVVFGAMNVGSPETKADGARITDLKDIGAVLDAFAARGYTEVDTARFYNKGTSEEWLGKANWKAKGLAMETKIYPTKRALTTMKGRLPQWLVEDLEKNGIVHSPEDLRKHLAISLEKLQTDSIETFYLHGPDRAIPYEDTLKGVDALYREGKFKRFGLSNFMSWEVVEIVGICKAKGYVQPTVYEGVYSAIQRTVEPELFPALRKFGISFYAFSPLAGGFFTGKYTSMQTKAEDGSRLDPNDMHGSSLRSKYWNEPHFAALAVIDPVIKKHNLTMPEVGMRWIANHSQLKREFGDAVLVGASSIEQLNANLDDLEKDPLPEDVVKALDEAWAIIKGHAGVYFH